MPPKKSTKKAVPKVDGEEDTLEDKLDAFMNKMIGIIDARLPKEDAEESEEDPNTAKLDAGAKIFREILLERNPQLTKEKLDAWDYDKLLTAIEILPKLDTQPILNEIVGKKDSKVDNTPPWLRTVVN